MKTNSRLSSWLVCASLAAVPLLVSVQSVSAAEEKKPEKPSITLLEVPNIPPGPVETGEIKGKVTGISSGECKVVIYSKGGDVYYVQPTEATPYTGIGKDGTFSDDVHGGTEYVALLVKKSYKPAPKIDKIPEEGDQVLAIDRKRPEKSK